MRDRSAWAGGRAPCSRRIPGPAGPRRRPTSRTTRSPVSTGGGVASSLLGKGRGDGNPLVVEAQEAPDRAALRQRVVVAPGGVLGDDPVDDGVPVRGGAL